MRSRYSAYVLKNENYLLKTWHHSTRPALLELEKDKAQWKKLAVIFSSDQEVHFAAFFSTHESDSEKFFSLYEESKFIKENDCWFYLNGDNLKTLALTKNMLCPCQSGKKFKRCCEKDMQS